MARTLTKDERQYIINELVKRLENDKEAIISLRKEYNQIVYDNLPKDFYKILKELEKYSGSTFIESTNEHCYYGFDHYGDSETEFNFLVPRNEPKKFISFRCAVSFDKDVVKKLDSIRDKIEHLYKVTRIPDEILTRHCVLFATWVVKPKDRIDKINELIDMMYKELTI